MRKVMEDAAFFFFENPATSNNLQQPLANPLGNTYFPQKPEVPERPHMTEA